MANSYLHHILLQDLQKSMESYLTTEDDVLIYDAFLQDDIRHVCQAIRHIESSQIVTQHMTLRFGCRAEQSVHRYELTEEIRYLLDFYSLYLGIKQNRFQLDTLHPDFISSHVIPIDTDALLWQPGSQLLQKLFHFDKQAVGNIIFSLQVKHDKYDKSQFDSLCVQIKQHASAIWFEINGNSDLCDMITRYKPEKVKIAINIANVKEKKALLPLSQFLRQQKMEWVVGRVANENELKRFHALGATHYFGYVSDIPTSLSA